MTTKQEQKDQAFKVFDAIVDPASKAYDAKVDQAYKAYDAIVGPARKAYNAKCKEIDEQGELTVKDIR